VVTTIDGALWTQPVFPYQLKCLNALLESYAALNSEARVALEPALIASGCQLLLGTE
jgi:hypothetical protein